MDEWIEIEGKNKKDAIERACNALNTNTSHLKYEILDEGKTTKIRAMKVDKVERGDRVEPKKPRVDETEETTEGEAYADGDDAEMERGENEGEEVEAREPREERPRKPVPPDAGEKSKEALLTIVKYIDPTAEVMLTENDQAIELNIKGERGGVLIGKYGQTLGALQYIVAKMIGLDRADGKRLVLDSEEYLARRKESLEILAEKLAEKAVRTGRPVGAEPMSASDRRTLHMALAEDPDVTTKSIGEGYSRRVLILPKGYEESRRRGGGGGRSAGGRPSSGGRSRNGGGGRSGGGRSGGGRSGGGNYRDDNQQDAAPGRRRAGPPPRKHDSFDAPPEGNDGFFEEDDAPLISDFNKTDE